MKHTLRDYQSQAVDDAVQWFGAAKAGDRRCYSSPTGTGKSVMLLAVQERLQSYKTRNDPWIITPRLEIVAGLLDKLGVNSAEFSEARLVSEAWSRRITTPLRLRNAMIEGRFAEPLDALLLDECHHGTADTYKQLDLLTGTVPAAGFTATAFRGTPRGTAEFRSAWGEPVAVLTLPEAIDRGVLSFPVCDVAPLVDDDKITVTNGEFVCSEVGTVVTSRLGAVVDLAAAYYDSDSRRWDRPTMFACPNTETALLLTDMLNAAGCWANDVTQDTSRRDRQIAFNACVDRTAALVQINVVSEGVDLPIRRLIDLAPMMSPVRWLQQLGRITRPVAAGETAPHYLCTNRNLLRHAYLLEGCLPAGVMSDAQAAFDGPGKRLAARVLGLEALGRLKAVELPLLNGLTGLAYCVSAVDGARVTDYAVIVHPLKKDPIWAKRQRVKAIGSAPASYGRWVRSDAPEGLSGFASVPASPLSEKQAAWWKRSAARCGLDPDAKVTRKNFVALPVLSDLRERI